MKKWKPSLAPFRKFKKEVFAKASLVADFIYQIGESEDLRKPSNDVPVSKIKSPEYQAKFKYLKNCLKKYRKLTGYGRGITAVQVGIPERFSVIYVPNKPTANSQQSTDKKSELLIIINPKITKESAKKYLYPEMCMSSSYIIAPTIRPAWIEFDYFDERGKLNKWGIK